VQSAEGGTITAHRLGDSSASGMFGCATVALASACSFKIDPFLETGVLLLTMLLVSLERSWSFFG
jgi:hypothetical protein